MKSDTSKTKSNTSKTRSGTSKREGQEISDFRADLENLVSRISRLSNVEVEEAKEKLIAKIVYTTKAARYSNMRTRYAGESAAVFHLRQAFLEHAQDVCNSPDFCLPPRVWCDEFTDNDGKVHPAECCDPDLKVCRNPSDEG